MKDLVQKLKPFVTTFSAAVDANHEHEDEIVVGGKIIDVLNMADWLPESDTEKGVYITLDDGVGHNHIVLPDKAYQVFGEAYDLSVGQVILAEGRVFKLDTTHTYQKRGKTVTVDMHEDKTTRILAWEVKPLPEKVEENV